MVYALLRNLRMPAETVLACLLVAQGVMGAADTLINHELLERLPHRPKARPEIGLHWIREALYGALFIGLGWFDWLGTAALVIAALLVAEIAVDAMDEWTENRIRRLPQNERLMHFFLVLNLGAITAVLAGILPAWHAEPTGLLLNDRGWLSWLLLLLGLSSAGWAVRDFLAWRRLSALERLSADTAGRPARASAR